MENSVNSLADIIDTINNGRGNSGSGAASNTAKIAKLQKAYQSYVVETQAMGETPVTFDEFARSYGVNSNPYQNPKP